MYYSEACKACGKVFYTFNDSKTEAAKILFQGIKKHMEEYQEDLNQYEMEYDDETEINMFYKEMTESKEAPQNAYQLE